MVFVEAISPVNFYGGSIPRPFLMLQKSNADQAVELLEGRRALGLVEGGGRLGGVLRNNEVLLDFASKVGWNEGGLLKAGKASSKQPRYGEMSLAQREKMALACNIPANFTSSQATTPTVISKQKRNTRKQTKKVDPRKPKRAISAYSYFVKAQGQRATNEGLVVEFGDFMVQVGAEWQALKPAQKKQYEKMHQVEKARYDEANAAYKIIIAKEKAEKKLSELASKKLLQEIKKGRKKSVGSKASVEDKVEADAEESGLEEEQYVSESEKEESSESEDEDDIYECIPVKMTAAQKRRMSDVNATTPSKRTRATTKESETAHELRSPANALRTMRPRKSPRK